MRARTTARIGIGVTFVAAIGIVSSAMAVQIVRSWSLYATLGALSEIRDASVIDSEILNSQLYEPETVLNDLATVRRGRVLLIVVAGAECRDCMAVLAAWETELHQGLRVPVRVAAVDAGKVEREFVERMRAAGVDAGLLQIRETAQFKIHTGVKSVPMAFLLDGAAGARVVVSGMPSERVMMTLRKTVRGERPKTAPVVFEHNAGTDWLVKPPGGPPQ